MTSQKREAIGVIGLGLMGQAMAERLLAAGFAVIGFDTGAKQMDALRSLGGLPAEDVQQVAAGCRRILLSLPNDSVVAGVLEELRPRLSSGQILIDTSTGDPGQAAVFATSLSGVGAHYLEATISGSSAQVRSREVLVMGGGSSDVFEGCRDLFQPFAAALIYAGPAGAAAKLKLVTNLVLGLNRAALAEGLAFARAVGLDEAQALAALRASAAYSRTMDSKGEKMIRRDFEPQARLAQHLKDVRLMLEAAKGTTLNLPLTRTHRALLEAAEAAGLGSADNSAIICVYDKPADEGGKPS